MSEYLYFALEEIPCRLKKQGDAIVAAEIYRQGEGFVPGPEMMIRDRGCPLSKAEFDKLLMQFIRKPEA